MWSPDTDVLILLIYLASRGRIGPNTRLKFLTWKKTKYREIYIQERVHIIRIEKSIGLVGFHNFTSDD